MTETAIHIFGVRHHGPGSSRSLLRALEEVKPQCLLIEGPPDADAVMAFAAREELVPPAAILVYAVDSPSDAVYYPFAEFSPEWQAIRWGLAAGIAVRFMDLPQWHRIAICEQRLKAIVAAQESEAPAAETEPAAGPGSADITAPPSSAPRPHDPLAELARAAGFDDGERWWEHVVEHNRDGDLGLFVAIKDAMAELRQGRPESHDPDEPLREAWMRRTIREAKKQGHTRIAVVCGAWHAPVLDIDGFAKKPDDSLLSGLPKTKTTATWIPWTYERLTYASGYGAGIQSPGWYEHLWLRDHNIIESWMTRSAHLLRGKDIDCSSASVIEAVRLSEALATMRGRPLADLSDIADATRCVFCFDNDLPMRLIARDLLVGDRLGTLPDDIPMVPLQQDLQRLQKRLRLKPEASERLLELDLRNENDRERSHLLHRLRLLGLHWGTSERQAAGKGTFRETWKLRWEPHFAIRLIEAGVLGTTIEGASGAKLRQLAGISTDLRELSTYLQDAMLAELGAATADLVRQIESVAAVAADVTLLMQILPQLASLLRYGNVRQTDAAMVREIVDGILPRITAGLGGAVASLNDDAATVMERHLRAAHEAVQLLESPPHTKDWFECLRRVVDADSVHGLVRGRCARLLFDASDMPPDQLANRLSLALSRGNDPAQGARWLEGFLSGSGLLLIHDPRLFGLIDAWVTQIQPDLFQELLPLLRRTFATFPPAERRQIGQMVPREVAATARSGESSVLIDPDRGARALPLLVQILSGGKT